MISIDLLDLDLTGVLLHPDRGTPVAIDAIPDLLETALHLGDDTTDIFVYVHGWRTPVDRAEQAAQKLFELVEGLQCEQPQRYPRLSSFRPQFICVRWPSASRPTAAGYRMIRDRAAAMSASGHAAHVLASLLGYFNERRRPPESGPEVLKSAYGQYLHCVGHSFGGRFLAHAIIEASARQLDRPDTLSWQWGSNDYPWTADSFTIFQMAAPAEAFDDSPFSALLGDTMLNAPIALTFSRHDRALGLWHRKAEKGRNGIGYLGATAPKAEIFSTALKSPLVPYVFPDQSKRIMNVDAGGVYRSTLKVEGAHSDYFWPESAHLLLSLAEAAR